jgi:GTP-binding protein
MSQETTSLELNLSATRFLMGCPTFAHLPTDDLPEVAVAGRSNAGKSSLINNICNQNKLARVSQTPGKTREINLYSITTKKDPTLLARLVDLPGYGYAKVSHSLQRQWQSELGHYLAERANLRTLIIIVDARREPTALDMLLMSVASKRGLKQILICNKVDKLTQSTRHVAKLWAEQLVYNTPNSNYLFYSSPKNIGRDELTKRLASILEHDETEQPRPTLSELDE